MKIAIHNPYLDTLGGGERYTVSFVKSMIAAGHQVDIQWSSNSIIKDFYNRFGIDIKEAKVVEDIKRGDGYDVTFWVSDGSIPTLKSRKNILHFQVPFHDVNGTSLLNKMKMFRINHVVCNSNFTKKIIDKEYGVQSLVIYPPIDTDSFIQSRKEDVILYVGRFSNLKQSKHQEVLVDCFKKICDSGIKNWKLVLAGGSEVGNNGYVDSLKKISLNYPIEFLVSPNFKTLKNIYGKSKIFWSAAGFSEDNNNPENFEHFGMTVVEAMASKCIPVIYNGGGHPEIIDDGKNGLLWSEKEDLVLTTLDLINSPKKIRYISNASKTASYNFGFKRFEKEFNSIVS